MTDPDPENPDVIEAARSSRECADVLRESQRFEQQLAAALEVPARPGLAADLIARRQALPQGPGISWMLATAAAVVLAVGVVTFQFLPDSKPGDPDLGEVWRHLASHWEHDGAQVLAASQSMRSEASDIADLLGGLGVDVDTELTARFTLGKICPTPDGDGAHLILDTEDGPITLIVMPDTPAPETPTARRLHDGQEAWLVGLNRGSVAVIADPNRGAFEIARRIRQQISIDDSLRL
jgi:hypothetical protein